MDGGALHRCLDEAREIGQERRINGWPQLSESIAQTGLTDSFPRLPGSVICLSIETNHSVNRGASRTPRQENRRDAFASFHRLRRPGPA